MAEQLLQSKRRQPVVVVGTVLNSSHEHINVNTFVTDLERELTNSQKVTFVAGKGEREEVRTERKEQAMYAQGGYPESSGQRDRRRLHDEGYDRDDPG